jgi:hypothetical protein
VSLQEHDVKGGVSVHVLVGRLLLLVAAAECALRAGEIAALAPRVRHRATALSDCCFLMTMAMA